MTFQNGHALLIGVGDDLPNTEDDARGLAAILSDAERCAYPPKQVVTLTGPDASRHGVLTALDQLAAASDTDATVVVYFSGHGYQAKSSMGQQYYLMPYGYSLAALFDTGVSGKEFADKLRAIPAKRLLLLLDCCHAGGVGEEKAPGLTLSKAPLPAEAQSVFAKGAGRVLIASSRADELSYAGRPFSAFTLALIEALAGEGVAKRDGYVRWADVALHAREKVPQRTNDRQHPIIDLDEADNFVLGYYAGGAVAPKALAFAVAPEIEPEPGAFRGVSVNQQAGRDLINAQGSQGFLQRPSGPVTQHFGHNVDTGGGLYSAGNLTAGRDVVGRDRNQGLSGAEIDRLFAPLADVVAHADPGVRTDASRAVQELKTEAAKADKADDGRIARLIDGLVDLVPAAIGSVTSIFASPLLGKAAGNATRFVLEKLKT